MKSIKKSKILLSSVISFSIIILNLISCSSDTCDYDKDPVACVPNGPNKEYAGFTVSTCYGKNANDPVAVIFETQFNSTAPKGDDWGNHTPTASTTQVVAIHPTNWVAGEIGQVFGIAIDNDENIYLASSFVYSQGGIFPAPTQNAIPAQVYKCSAPNWTAVPLFTLPNTGIGALNGIGNIAYDKRNDQLFVSNLEDGKIYRYDTSGTQLGVFDPWVADTNTAGTVAQAEQVWGLGVNYELSNTLLYFAGIGAGTRTIFSVTLNNDGSFPSGINPEVPRIIGVPGTQNTITDIAFSSDSNEMLISERGDAHNSKVMSFSRTGVSWFYNRQYFAGANAVADGENSAGGVDFAYQEIGGDISANCDEFFWATSNFMYARNLSPADRLYGLQGISYLGNNSASAVTPTANQDTDMFIDFNGTYFTTDKFSIGDVEVFDATRCFNLCDEPR